MNAICRICDYPFKHEDKLVVVALSTFVAIDSDITFAVTEPTKCLELIHRDCYDFDSEEDKLYYMGLP